MPPHLRRAVVDTNLLVRGLLQRHPAAAAPRLLKAVIVTDDRHDLLPLKDLHVRGYRVIHVVTPTAFLARLGVASSR